MTALTVRRLARMAGVSVRTLHHYDKVGLLSPKSRTKAGYRLYGQEELFRLQQILFYKEMDFPLPEIARILDEPDFNPVDSLLSHRKLLEERLGRLHRLMDTLDKTISHYQGGKMLTDEEMYQGFTPEKIARMKREARGLWGAEIVDESEKKVRNMSKAAFAAVMREGESVNLDLARLISKDPSDKAVQSVIARHHAWILHFWTPTEETYRGLGMTYKEHPEFRAFYEKYAPGLADFLQSAIERYCENFPENGAPASLPAGKGS
jgi:DNA-binding transcriptional MerR regulator